MKDLASPSTPQPAGNTYAEGVLETDATMVNARVAIGVKNEGGIAAGETLLNVVFPRRMSAYLSGPPPAIIPSI